MESYQLLFPPPPSSYVSSVQPEAFSSGELNNRALDGFEGNPIPGGTFLEMMGEEPRADASSEVTRRDAQMEENRDSGEVKPPKKKGERKVRKHRYAFQTRSQVDILDDGYRWRKYGQKAVKNNRFPRSYYRCTHQGCNVKKQVQRLSKDEGVVVTTYEGTHTHPIEKSNDNFEQILSQMQIYTPF